MANRNKGRSQKRRNKSVARDRRARRMGTSSAHVRKFVAAEGLDVTEARIAQAAMPAPWRYHTSHWLEAGLERAVKRTECTALEAIAVIERMQRWAHRIGRVSQKDVALQTAGLELLRRRYGGEPRVIALPEPLRPTELAVDELRMLVAQWEGMSYGMAITKPGDTDLEKEMLLSSAIVFAVHLGEVDGVPIRLHRLDPEAYVAWLRDKHGSDGPGDADNDTRWLAQMLACIAELYACVAERPAYDRDKCRAMADELSTRAMAMAGPSYAA